ncbi:MAG: calcium-binding protein, partial [Pseudomonadota bacterium]
VWHTDTVEELADEGYDVVYSSVTFALPDNVEELILIGDAAIDATGNAADNTLGGNNASNILNALGGDDTLYGWAGNDRLDGGTGADWMDGGVGDDVYVVDDAGDRVIENADAGTDTVLSSIDYALGDHVENVVLTGDAAVNATGNAGGNLLVGNDAANTLRGLDGDDSLYGRGGNDILDGGAGNDTYYITVNDGIDTLIDIEGDDTLVFGNCITPERVAVRYATDGQGHAIASLRLLDAEGCESETEGVDILLNSDGSLPIEHVRFADGTVTTFDSLVVRSLTHTGTDKADRIVTGRDDDTIHALGGNDVVDAGSGHDTLYGGKGKDVLYGGGGNDRLHGEDGNDTLYGGCGNDTLDGGAGENKLAGGAGDDLILLGGGENGITFGLGDGRDTIRLVESDNKDYPGKGDDYDNEVHFGEGIAREQLWFERTGDDLVVRVLGTSDGMTIEDWYNLERKPIEEFETADGSELEGKQIERLVQAMAQFAPSLSADGTLPTDQQQELNAVIAAAWERG